MRKSTLLWLVLAAACGTALFHTSQRVHDGREKLEQLNTSIAKEEESLRVLTAEWGYLNQPARLEKLAKTYLKLAPMKGTQFAKLEDIPIATAPPQQETAPAEETATPVVNLLKKVEVDTAATEIAPAPKAIPPKVAAPKKPIIKAPATAAAPPVKIRKPAQPLTAAHKQPAPAPAGTNAAGNTRSFADLMKSLGAGHAQ